jgi:hypothetical protein
MVILHPHANGLAIVPFEYKAPFGSDLNRELSFSVAGERVKGPRRLIHVFRPDGLIERRKKLSQAFGGSWIDPLGATLLPEPSKRLV